MIMPYDNDYLNSVRVATNESKLPTFYEWIGTGQINEVKYTAGFISTIEWQAFLKDVPTERYNYYNTVSTIGFRNRRITTHYLTTQYKFGHFRQGIQLSDNIISMQGDINNNYLTYDKALTLAQEEIHHLLTQWFLTGSCSVNKDGSNEMVSIDGIPGILNYPKQIEEKVTPADKAKIEKWMEAVEKGVVKLQFGNEFKSEVIVLVDRTIHGMLNKPYTINNAVSTSGETWRDVLIKTIKAQTGNANVIIEMTNLLTDQIVMFPRNPRLLEYKFSERMLPTPNPQVDTSPSDISFSYLDFTLGGIIAKENVILSIPAKA